MTKIRQVLIASVVLNALACQGPSHAASAGGQGVVVTVNDQPITTFDVDQRIKLWSVLGGVRGGDQRKKALDSLIDDIILQAEAKKYKLAPKDSEVDAQLEHMAKGGGSDLKDLSTKLKKQGLSLTALRAYVASQIAFNRWLVSVKKDKVQVDQSKVDQKYKEILSDPRMKPITVYQIQEVQFPVDQVSEAMMGQLIMARAADAQQYAKQYKGCGSAQAAAAGIYNVQVKKTVEADATKIPPPLRAALEKAGPGHLIGPARGKGGLQMIGFCGRRFISPPKPSRDVIERIVENETYDEVRTKYLHELRTTALIDYKNASEAQ
jgi:peptidyl-prolyl cis-trans isomerase SurA